MKKEYYCKNNVYNHIRHLNALDLNFVHIELDKYKLPKLYSCGLEIIVDLSASGNEQIQILKTSLKQVAEQLKEEKETVRDFYTI